MTALSAVRAISPKARAVLQDNGVSRLEEFAAYPVGWDALVSGGGAPLDPAAVSAMDALLVVADGLEARVPSVFLFKDGSLTLAWEDDSGEAVEVDCRADGYTVFIGRWDTELGYARDEPDKAIAHALGRFTAPGQAPSAGPA